MNRRLLARLRKSVLWLMVPMVLLANRAAIGCVCADGTVLPVCCKSEPFLAGLCGEQGHDCCAKVAFCPHCKPHSSSKSLTGPSDLKNGDCGCRSLPNYVDTVKTENLKAPSLSHGLAVLATWPNSGPSMTRVRLSADRSQCPLMLDRVVVFLHLTI